MQNLKEFTRKSSKVAGAILSAAMVTSMIAGTNVLQAAEVNTQTEADVNANVHVDTETAKKATDYLKTELGKLKVTSSSQINAKDSVVEDERLTKFVTKAQDTYLITEGAIVLKIDMTETKEPTEDKAGNLTVKIIIDGNETGTVNYVLPSGQERTAATEAAIKEYIDGLTVTNANIDSFLTPDNVQDYLKSQMDGDFKLYPDTIVTEAVAYGRQEATEDKDGSVKRVFVGATITDAAGETIGNAMVETNKVVKTYAEIMKEVAKAVDTYLGEVKYFGATVTEEQASAVINDLIEDKYAGTGISCKAEDGLGVEVGETATKNHDGSAKITYTIEAEGTKTTITQIKEIVLPNADTKTKQIIADLKTVAAAMAVTEDTDASQYETDFLNKFKDTFKDITVGTGTDDVNAYNTVYGDDVTKVVVKLAKGDATNSSIAFFNVQVEGADEVTDRYVYTAKEEETHKPGKGTLPDGRPCIYGNDGKPLTGFIQANENGDANDNNTYFAGNDGHLYVDQLTYAQNGKDILYFDAEGHMAFDKFIVAKKDMNGNALSGNPIYFFNSEGRMYINQTTYGSGKDGYDSTALYYINEYGVLQQNGWYRTADGNITYAAADGKLTTSKWGIDQFGRKVYFQANGFLAKGTITDGVKYYQLDADDGHLISEF